MAESDDILVRHAARRRELLTRAAVTSPAAVLLLSARPLRADTYGGGMTTTVFLTTMETTTDAPTTDAPTTDAPTTAAPTTAALTTAPTTTAAPITTAALTTTANLSTSSRRMASDRRLKRDIVPVAVTDSGLRLYQFRYLGDARVFTGVMAQDLRHDPRFRAAVHTRSSGLFCVDYGALGLEVRDAEAMHEAGQAAEQAWRDPAGHRLAA